MNNAPPHAPYPQGPLPGRPQGTAPQRGPERFASAPVEADRPSMGKAIGAAAALLALLVGLPALLWVVSGPPPFPHGLPSREDLTQPLTTEALFVVLRVVVWLAWLQFAVCTVVEIVSLVRGGGLPRPVPLSGRSQALARALVGTVLIGGSFLGSTGAASAVTAEPLGSGPGTSLTAASTTTVGAEGTLESPGLPGAVLEGEAKPWGEGAAEQTQVRMAHVPGVPAEMTDVIGHKVAVVKAPDGHYHDNLWDIAERHLGDGRRWKEIYELNKGRQQPDGQQLVLGRLIQPGWVLKMPDDATGLSRVRALPTGAQSAGAGASGTLTPTAVEASPTEQSGLQTQHLVGGGLLAAVLLGALAAERRRRRGRSPTDEELEAEVALRVGADEARVAWLDRSLRGLGSACRTEQVPLPQVYAVCVSDEAIELRIAPAAPVAPAPWSVRDEGRLWRLDKDNQGSPEPGHAPYPGLVCLGRDDSGADVLVDLEAVGGILSLDGDPKVAGEIVSALAVQLATAPWADEQRVRGFRLAPVLAEIGGSPIEEVDDLSALVAELSAHPVRRDAGEVLTGRLGRHPGVPPQYLVLGARPDDDTTERLADLAEVGTRGLAVVSASLLPGTRWHLVVDEAGRLSVPLLDLEVDAVRIDASSAELLGGLLAKARADEPTPTTERAVVPEPARPGDDAAWSTAAVRVGVLGRLEVRTEGRLDPARLELATELATFVALQPAPVHPSVVAASIWPRGVTPEVRDATIARVRDWLGTDADGNHLLRETDEGRLHLADEVAVDWHALCTLVRRAHGRAPHEERELLRRALHLVRGPVLEGRSGLRWAWLARTRLERQATDVVVLAALRLARLCLDDDPDGAAAACRTGLRVAPTAQVLWRMLLLAESRRPDGPGTAQVVDDMLVRLQGVGAPLEAETEALVAELMPSHESA